MLVQEQVARGPGLEDHDPVWSATLDELRAVLPDGRMAAARGWNLDWEREQRQTSLDENREHVSVRVLLGEAIVGPRWVPGENTSCAGCAEVRERSILEHPLVADLGEDRLHHLGSHPLLATLIRTALPSLAIEQLAPGELLVVGAAGTRRHLVARSIECVICGRTTTTSVARARPARLVLKRDPAVDDDATRGRSGLALTRRNALRNRLVDNRYGPVRAMLREAKAPFAMSGALLPDSPNMGYGRALTFAETEAVAIIEVYERLGGFPFDAPVVPATPFSEIRSYAVDPGTLGRYTQAQLAHPLCKVMPSDAETPMDWVWGHDLATGEPQLVPADIAFFQYDYRFRRNRRAARAAGPAAHRKYFHESSSGCAAGASLEEAALHSLLELAERDAFLLSWHRSRALPRIRNTSIGDPETRALIELVEARGFDVHLLVATQDIALPVVWALVVNRDGGFPASFSSGGSGARPASAVRGALREVTQLVTMDKPWDLDLLREMHADPWLVEELEQHPMLGSLPEMLPRVATVLGGPEVSLDEAFPGWPHVLTRAAGGDVTGALSYVQHLFRDAGLDKICLVDQTTREHLDVGISVVKAVVPGIVPMCFGYAQQRLVDLPRFDAAIAGISQARREVPFDPHPFP